MPVKMIAVGRYYDRDAAKEYTTGQAFVVANDRIADRLERACRAKRDVVKPEPPKAEIKTRVMKAETPVPVVPEVPKAESENPVVVDSLDTGARTVFRGNRYRRNDLRSED